MIVTPTLALLGIATLYWRKEVADGLCEQQMGILTMMFGDGTEAMKPALRTALHGFVIFFGVVLFMAAAAAYFGPLDFTCAGHLCPRPPGYPL